MALCLKTATYICLRGFPDGNSGKEPANAGDKDMIPGLERNLDESMATHSDILT